MGINKKPKICLIEPCHSHEEVLYPLIVLLRDDYDVYVIAPQSLLDVDLLSRTKHLYTALPIIWNQDASKLHRFLRMPGKYNDVRRIINSINPDCVLFNSTHNILDMFYIAMFFKSVRKVQIIHEFNQFLKPGMRWLYNQFNLNLVISEQVYSYVKTHNPDFNNLDYVLPIYFEGFFESAEDRSRDKDIDTSYIKLGVFGSIDSNRRNYRGLLDAIREICANSRDPRFRVYLVGKAPQWLQDEIKQYNLAGVVEIYSEFVSFQKMFDILNEMDLVLFLIDNAVSNSRYYNKYKISGTSTLVKAFKKAGLSSTDFNVDSTLVDRCFYYKGTDIKSFLNRINNEELTKIDIQNKIAAMHENAEFTFEKQKERLVSMINRMLDRT